MRGRYPAPSAISYSFGPGGITPAVKALILANVALFVTGWFIERTAGIRLDSFLGLRPVAVIEGFQLWQPVTYLFLHGGFLHILFNGDAVLPEVLHGDRCRRGLHGHCRCIDLRW
jgi:membrane associated rhomboid family serine protease